MTAIAAEQSQLRTWWLFHELSQARAGVVYPLVVAYVASFAAATGADLGLGLQEPDAKGYWVDRGVVRLYPPDLNAALVELRNPPCPLLSRDPGYLRPRFDAKAAARVDADWKEAIQARLQFLPLCDDVRLALYAAAACGLRLAASPAHRRLGGRAAAARRYLEDGNAVSCQAREVTPEHLGQILAMISQRFPLPCAPEPAAASRTAA